MDAAGEKEKTTSQKISEIDEESSLMRRKTRFFIETCICEGFRVLALYIIYRVIQFATTFGSTGNDIGSTLFNYLNGISITFCIVLWALLIIFQLKKDWRLLTC